MSSSVLLELEPLLLMLIVGGFGWRQPFVGFMGGGLLLHLFFPDSCVISLVYLPALEWALNSHL